MKTTVAYLHFSTILKGINKLIMNDNSADQPAKFTKINELHSSYHDFVCYLGYEQATGLQVFWYEFLNDSLSQEDIQESLQMLNNVKNNISNQYILKVLDVWTTSNPSRTVVITEATQALSLADYLKSLEAPLPPRTMLKWFRHLAYAVQALHNSSLQITHGRINLQNVFIKPTNGTVKLRLPLTELSKRKLPISSLNLDIYKAPERLRGVIKPSNDIWALGIILLELMTHTKPYSEYKTPFDLIQAISQHIRPESINSVNIPAVADLIKACLQPEMFRISIDALIQHPAFDEITSPQPPLNSPAISQILVSNENKEPSTQNNSPTQENKENDLLDLDSCTVFILNNKQ